MRITQLLLSKGFGGGERYFVDLCRSLATAGHQVQAICHRHAVCARVLESESALEMRTVNLFGLWDLLGVLAVRRLVAQFGPDIVHGHLARGAWAGGKAVKGRDVALVANLHNYVKLKYYRGVDLFIPVTRHQETFLRRSGVPAEKSVFIPNFSPLAPVADVKPTIDGPVRFVSYGRMVAKKGFQDLVRAFARVRGSRSDVTLAIGGDGPQRKHLARLAETLGMADQIRFPGWIEDVSALLAEADVFVLPSRLEPFGIVVLEAMSAGVPIVTTRTEGPVEVLDDETAYFAGVASPDSLACAMSRAAADCEGRVQRACNALERYRHRYHHGVVVPQIVGAYERAIDATRPQ